ncbi:MAG: toxin-antitoxin system HicB family antitoxin [Gallionellaceae bacterium]
MTPSFRQRPESNSRFIVRVPSLVHRALATEAAGQGVSINRLVSTKLATW